MNFFIFRVKIQLIQAMKILKLTNTNHDEVIKQAVKTLSADGLVVYPTETTYGIGADCENELAIAKLLAYKSKRDGKPLSIAVSDMEMAEKYVSLNETAKQVYRTFLPGPVTVISHSRGVTAPGVDSRNGTLGIRIPNFPFTLSLIKAYGKGITATGANASYQKRPYSIQDIFDNISSKQKALISLVVDAGELPHNEPSTVIDTTLDDVQITRFGPVDFTDQERITSQNVSNTEDIAYNLISRYRSKLTYSPMIIALTGEMGAGKTHFSKGLARGLRITETITSPTYSLANEHGFVSEGRAGLLVHVDTWKMESEEDFKALNLEGFLEQRAIIVIEWADKFTELVKALGKNAQLIWVDLKTINENIREVTISHKN